MITSPTQSSVLPRVAFITSGLYFDPNAAQNQYRFKAMSQIASGEIFCVVWDRKHLGAEIANFRVRALALPTSLAGYGIARSIIRALAYIGFVLASALGDRLRNRKHYDLVISTDPLKSGLIARWSSRLRSIPYAVELNGNYEASMNLVDGSVAPWFVRLKARLAGFVLPRILHNAAAIKLLYEEQLGRRTQKSWIAKTHVFHNLVPIDPFQSLESDDPYILVIGYPWYLKGVDIAIKAFRKISDEFPDCELRIVGYCPDPSLFISLAAGHPKINLHPKGVEHKDAIQLINRCQVLVLPSRTEGMGRVLLEAMAASKPVIGSRVDGIPRVIRDGETGYLFIPEDADDLADKLRLVLGNPSHAQTLGRNGRRDVEDRLSPPAYIVQYKTFIESAIRANAP